MSNGGSWRLASALLLLLLLPATPASGAPNCSGLPATIVGTSGDDTIYGTPGPDVIHGRGGNDRIHGRDGDDVICGAAGDDRLHGGHGDDRVAGNRGRDRIWGGPGHDRLRGGAWHDHLFGGRGNDRLHGNRGHDTIWGGAGNDVLKGGAGWDYMGFQRGDDHLDGGSSLDTRHGLMPGNALSLARGMGSVEVDLSAGTLVSSVGTASMSNVTNVAAGLGPWRSLVIYGDHHPNSIGVGPMAICDADVVVLDGRDGDDRVFIDAGFTEELDPVVPCTVGPQLFGGPGNDSLWGIWTDDYIEGGAGTDRIDGHWGTDTCLEGEELYNCEMTE